jgi:NAD(P)-dependent dehydrogenase (short-subunit alcohol dehydrogenase family)
MQAQLFHPGMLQGSTALVSGGGTGIGFAIARQLGRLGARVAICSRHTDELEAAAETLRAEAIEVLPFFVNIRDENTVEALFAALKHAGWQPDILVNNAGGQFAAPALQVSPNGFRSVIDLNLTGTWLMSSAFARQFSQSGQRQGSIVSIVLAQEQGMPGMVHASASRAGVANMMKTLAYEWGPLGLTANAIAPGTVETAALARYNRAGLEATAARLPVARMASPEEIAQSVAYLVSPAARFITGITLQIDGGEHLLGAQPQTGA